MGSRKMKQVQIWNEKMGSFPWVTTFLDAYSLLHRSDVIDCHLYIKTLTCKASKQIPYAQGCEGHTNSPLYNYHSYVPDFYFHHVISLKCLNVHHFSWPHNTGRV